VPAFNGGFLVTCHEEAGAPVPRTAPQYAHDFSSGRLQMSSLPRGTFLVCLENTVSLGKVPKLSTSSTCPEIGVYTCESHSFVLKVRGSMEQLRSALKAVDNPDWKTVAVWPVNEQGQRVEIDDMPSVAPRLQLKKLWQEGGHSCTVRNIDNRIHALLMGIEDDCCFEDGNDYKADSASLLAWSGHELESSKVSSVVVVGKVPSDLPTLQHAMLLNYRGLAPVETVMKQVDTLQSHVRFLEWLSDKAQGIGAEQTSFLEGSVVQARIENAVSTLNRDASCQVALKYEANPGRSDASHVWRSLPDSLRGHRIVPLTCGPGHRSHRDKALNAMRKTHGMNEGFHKPTGLESLPFFLLLVEAFSVESERPCKRTRLA